MRGVFNETQTYETEGVLAFLKFLRRSKYYTHFFKNSIKENEYERKFEGRINPAHCEAMGRGLFRKKSKNPLSIFLYRFLVFKSLRMQGSLLVTCYDFTLLKCNHQTSKLMDADKVHPSTQAKQPVDKLVFLGSNNPH